MHPRRRSDSWVFVGLLALLAALPWPWGAVTPIFSALLAALTWLLLVIRLLLSTTGGAPLPRLPRPVVAVLAVWTALLAWTGLQTIPLPADLLSSLSPSAMARHAALSGLGATPPSTLSILPGVTKTQFLLALTYLGLFLLGFLTVDTPDRRRFLLQTLVVIGLLQALYGIGLAVAPGHWSGVANGSFVNRNHFAVYLTVCLSAGVALVLAELRGWRFADWRDGLRSLLDLVLGPKFRTRAFMVVMVAALVMSRSRGANLAFFAALAMCGSYFILARHPRWFLRSLGLFLSILLVDVLVISEWFGLEELVERIEDTQIEHEKRVLVWQDIQPLARDYLLTGSGLGSFYAAYMPYQSAAVRGYVDHAHNEYAEFLVELGVPGLILLALLVLPVIAHALRVLRQRREPASIAMAFAVVLASATLLLHAAGEFHLHIPAITATWMVLLGAAMRCRTAGGQKRESARPITESMGKLG